MEMPTIFRKLYQAFRLFGKSLNGAKIVEEAGSLVESEANTNNTSEQRSKLYIPFRQAGVGRNMDHSSLMLRVEDHKLYLGTAFSRIQIQKHQALTSTQVTKKDRGSELLHLTVTWTGLIPRSGLSHPPARSCCIPNTTQSPMLKLGRN